MLTVTLVSPEFPFSGRVPMVPPILEYLGALTRRHAPDAELQLLDANVSQVPVADVRGDLVGVSVWTATAPWVYRFADALRAAGKKVVLGGIHATALPEEAMQHADAVVVGEAESVWADVLHDARGGTLRRRYDGVPLPLDGLVTPLPRVTGPYRFRTFFTMRGCPHPCSFCGVRRFYGSRIRYRPVAEVVQEIEALAGRVWFNGDDNIWGGDPDRAVALFDALAAGKRRSWFGFGDLRSIQGPNAERILASARRSGLASVWVGWESDSPAVLSAFGATGKQGGDREAAIRRMQDHGLDVMLFVMLGSREDDVDSFRRALEIADRLRVGLHPVLTTPLPGTDLWAQYAPHLLPGLGWDAFTGTRAVFAHPHPEMTPFRRELEYLSLCNAIYSPGRILRRLLALPAKAFPSVHLVSVMMQLPVRRAMQKAKAAWERDVAPGLLPS
jgi:radical SAM superfamily enzyme YgiQ (UPF0313 family)